MKMKNFSVILFILLLFCTKINSQNMVKKKYLDIEFKEISDKAKNKLLKNDTNAQKAQLGVTDDNYYKLANGNVLFEITGLKNYLFVDYNDFIKFVDSTSKPVINDNFLSTFTHPIKDTSFIEKVNDYVLLFIEENDLSINSSNIENVKKVDELLNKIDLSQYKKFRLSLVAIVGECLLNELGSDASWNYFNYTSNGIKERDPVIMFKDTMLIAPATLVNEEYNKKIKNKFYKISLYRSIKEILG